MWPLVSALIVAVIGTGVAAQERPSAAGEELLRTRCQTCHGADLIRQQRLSRDGWTREIDKMIGWGAVLSPGDKAAVLELLAPVAAAAPSRGSEADAVLKARCSACHDARLIDQQRLSRDGWLRELDKMIGWGAALTAAERDRLASALAHF